jgi:hypothetical protein
MGKKKQSKSELVSLFQTNKQGSNLNKQSMEISGQIWDSLFFSSLPMALSLAAEKKTTHLFINDEACGFPLEKNLRVHRRMMS